MKRRSWGPIHFYSTYERSPHLAVVVEYVVQQADGQFVDRSGARWLVADGRVTVDGKLATSLKQSLPLGFHRLRIRGRTHHVMIHPAIKE